MPRSKNEIRDEADKRFYNIQNRLVRIQDNQRSELAALNSDMKAWESWLGAIAFSLAAISGAVLASPLSNYWALAATVFFLVAGIWIAIATKKRFEKSGRTLLDESNAEITLELKERNIVWDLSMHPERESELGPQLNLVGLEKMRNSQKTEEFNLYTIQKERIDYSNDIRLGIVITGIYLLIIPTLVAFLNQIQIPNDLVPLAISIPWFVLVLLLSYDIAIAVNKKQSDHNAHIERKQQNIAKIKQFADKFEKELEEIQ